MGKRKKILIDKKFQLRTVFSVTVVAMIFFSVTIAVLAFFLLNNKFKIAVEIQRLETAVETEDDIVSSFIIYAGKSRANPMQMSMERVNQDHMRSIADIQSHVAMLKEQTNIFFYLIMITACMAVAVAVVYYLFVMRITHRMAGPISVITGHIQDMIEGRDPAFRGLRKNDEFKELYGKLVELGGKIRKGGFR